MASNFPSLLVACWTVTAFCLWSPVSGLGLQKPEESFQFLCETKNVEMCPDHDDLPITLSNITLEMEGTDILYVSGVLASTETLQLGTRGIMKIHRCMKNDPNKCEKFVEYDIEDFCSQLPKEDELWTPIVKGLENLDPHCPVPANVFVVNEAPINVTKQDEPLEGYWRLEMTLNYEKRVITCFLIDVLIKLKRR